MVRTFLFLFMIFCSYAAHAQSHFSSPMTTPARYIVYTGSILTLVALATEKPIHAETVENKPLGKYSVIGDYAGRAVPNAIYFVFQGIAGIAGNRNGFRRAGGMFSASTNAILITAALKYSVREPRPNGNGERVSFPSGHSTWAFAFSTYVASEHGVLAGFSATLLAGFVAYSRMNDNMHMPHDVIAGATIGAAYGFGVSYLQRRRRGRSSSSFQFVPIIDHRTKGLLCRFTY